MATFLKSANFSGYNGSHFYISLYYDVLSQSSASNQSVVRYYLYTGSSDGYSGYGSYANGYIGDTWVGGSTSIGVNSFNYIGSRDLTYTHNNDGSSPTISYWASFNTSWGGVDSASLSGTFTLPKIARYPIITKGNNFTDEENPSVTFSNAGIYDIRAVITVGSTTIYSEDLSDRTVTSYEYELTTAQRNQLRQLCTGKTLSVKLSLQAISNNSVVNTSSTDVTMSIVNAEPTFTYTMVERNQNVIDVVGDNTASSIIDNASTVRITVTPSAKKYATISGVNITVGGTTYSDTESPYQIDVPVTDNIFTISVIDSRGYTTTQIDSNRTLIPYEQLKINSFSFKRENPISSNVILNADILYYDSLGSTVNVPEVKWKLDNGSFVTIPGSEYIFDSQNHKLTITDYELSNVLPYNQQGQFTLYIADLLTTTQDAGESGLVLKGVATFDAGEHDFQVNGTLYIADIDRNNKKSILDLTYPVGSIYMSVNNTSPATLFGGTWEQIEDTFLLSAGSTYTAGDTGGHSSHTITIDEMPTHSHLERVISNFGYPNAWVGNDSNHPQNLYNGAGGYVSGGTWTEKTGYGNETDTRGNSQAMSIMPPYLVVYVWKRTA